MRGPDKQQAHLFSYISPERRVPQEHPLRPIRAMVDAAFARLDAEHMPCENAPTALACATR